MAGGQSSGERDQKTSAKNWGKGEGEPVMSSTWGARDYILVSHVSNPSEDVCCRGDGPRPAGTDDAAGKCQPPSLLSHPSAGAMGPGTEQPR